MADNDSINIQSPTTTRTPNRAFVSGIASNLATTSGVGSVDGTRAVPAVTFVANNSLIRSLSNPSASFTSNENVNVGQGTETTFKDDTGRVLTFNKTLGNKVLQEFALARETADDLLISRGSNANEEILSIADIGTPQPVAPVST
jgi:hypothetical protein